MSQSSPFLKIIGISSKSVRYRLLSSSLTMLSVALGVAMMIAVVLVYNMVDSMFNQGAGPYHLVVGPKGSGIDLVLSSIYRIRPPIENVPWRFYQEFKDDPRLEACIPIAFGDYTQEEDGGFPVVGTIPQYFKYGYAPGKPFEIGREGETFLRGSFDAVIGSEVARRNGWGAGDTFQMIHGGTNPETSHVHDEVFTVRGVLQQTGTPNDRTVFIHLDGFLAVSGHEKPLDEAIAREMKWFGETAEEVRARYPELAQVEAEIAAHANMAEGEEHHHHHHTMSDLQKEVTALLVRVKASDDPKVGEAQVASYMQDIIAQMSEDIGALAVNPHFEVRNLMESLFGNIRLAMLVLTFLIIAVSGIGIFVSIYNSMSERKREIGIMRALGASRGAVLGIILTESMLLCVIGGVLGLLLGHGAIFIGAPYVGEKSGLVLDPLQFHWAEILVIPAMLAMACLVGALPALTAYRTDVAEALSHG